MARGRKISELKVVFDTNALYTKAESELLSAAATSLIDDNSSHSDLKISWYLPEVVRHEREYQMRKEAFKLLQYVERLDRLLGHNLNITSEILEARVRDAIDRSLQEHNIEVLNLVAENVDWKRLISDSSFRKPPFEIGENEKGFRDAIIVEIFLQLVEQSPTTPSICRLVLVSNDGLLSETVALHTKDNNNVKVVHSIADLEGFINTLVSKVTEEFIEQIKEKTQLLFFDENNENNLWHKEEVWKKINDTFSNELKTVPEPGQIREHVATFIRSPNFVKKKSQRVFWLTSVEIKVEIYRNEVVSDLPRDTQPSGALSGFSVAYPSIGTLVTGLSPSQTSLTATSISSVGPTNPFSRGLLSAPLYVKKKEGSGRSIFEILWSVQVSQSKSFSKAKIEKLEFIETVWEL